MRRSIWALLALASCLRSGEPHEPSSAHAEAYESAGTRGASGPTTDQTINLRLQAVANDLKGRGEVSRIAIGDIAYPRTQAENVELGGWGLVLVTALTRDPSELPIKRVVVRSSAGEMELQAATTRLQLNAELPPDVKSAFGAHRFDGLYYIPVAATRVECKVVIDFAANRTNFQTLQFPPPPDQDALPRDVEVIVEVGAPNPEAAQRLFREEFPFLAKTSR
jgi:hypothetical protein